MLDANIGYLFYNEYYKALTCNDWIALVKEKKPLLSVNAIVAIQKINNRIKSGMISAPIAAFSIDTKNRKCFDLITTYPGLLMGSGNAHSAGDIQEAFKLGFHFDHTTGMPVIPGSSIKGRLRSAFPNQNDRAITDEEKEDRRSYIRSILIEEEISELDIDKLEMAIFEGISPAHICGNSPSTSLPIYKRDLFFDAYIVSSKHEGQRFLDEDNITPHHKDELTNPTPIRFIKVLPEVIFRFQFDLKDGLIKAEEKCRLFERILLDRGIGAKTNVGYGQFSPVVLELNMKELQKQREKEEKLKEATKKKRLEALSPIERLFEEYNNDIPDVINAMKNGALQDAPELKREAATQIKSMMLEKGVWERQKKPKDKTRVSYIRSILGEA